MCGQGTAGAGRSDSIVSSAERLPFRQFLRGLTRHSFFAARVESGLILRFRIRREEVFSPRRNRWDS